MLSRELLKRTIGIPANLLTRTERRRSRIEVSVDSRCRRSVIINEHETSMNIYILRNRGFSIDAGPTVQEEGSRRPVGQLGVLRALEGRQYQTSRASLLRRLTLEVGAHGFCVRTPLLEEKLTEYVDGAHLHENYRTLGGEKDKLSRWFHVLPNEQRWLALGTAGLLYVNSRLAVNLGHRPCRAVQRQDTLSLSKIVRERIGVVAETPGRFCVPAADENQRTCRSVIVAIFYRMRQTFFIYLLYVFFFSTFSVVRHLDFSWPHDRGVCRITRW